MDPYEQSGGDAYGQGQGDANPQAQEEDLYDEDVKPQHGQWVVSYSSDTTYHQQQSYSQQPQEGQTQAQYPPQYHQHQQYQHEEYQQHQDYQQYQQQYQEYHQQSYPEHHQPGAQQYSQYQSAAQQHQPYQTESQAQEGEAVYGADQAAYSVGNHSSSVGARSQYPSMMQQLLPVPVSTGVMPPTAEEHRRLVQAASGYSDTYTTESLTSDPIDYTDQDWTEEDINYATPIDYNNLPSRTSQDEKTRKKAEKMAKESLERYRKRMKGDEEYKKKKEELLRKINDELKRDAEQLRKQKAFLFEELKRHDHMNPNCKCSFIHQYLYFTKENKHISREQAFGLGWLTKEELELLQCRSPEHSPNVSRAGSGKSSYGGGNGGGGGGDGIKTEDDGEGGGEGSSRKRSGRHESRKASGGGGKDDRYYKDRDSGGKHSKKSGRKGTK